MAVGAITPWDFQSTCDLHFALSTSHIDGSQSPLSCSQGVEDGATVILTIASRGTYPNVVKGKESLSPVFTCGVLEDF